MCLTISRLEILKGHNVVLAKKSELYFDLHIYSITEVIMYTWKCLSFP